MFRLFFPASVCNHHLRKGKYITSTASRVGGSCILSCNKKDKFMDFFIEHGVLRVEKRVGSATVGFPSRFRPVNT